MDQCFTRMSIQSGCIAEKLEAYNSCTQEPSRISVDITDATIDALVVCCPNPECVDR